jgi:hypothetical protein
MGKGVGKNCTGGMKQEFHAGSKAEEIANDVASELHEQLSKFLPSVENLHPQGEEMEAMMAFDDEAQLAGMEVDVEKVVEFGGFAKIEWGCKVTYAKKRGKFSKTVECGAKSEDGMGKKPKLEH